MAWELLLKSNSRCWSMTKLWSVPTSFKDKWSDLEILFIWSTAQWRKVKQMQPMWLCFVLCKRFEETFENTQWGKVKQMHPVWFCLLSNEFFDETYEETQTNVDGYFHIQQSFWELPEKQYKPWKLKFIFLFEKYQ